MENRKKLALTGLIGALVLITLLVGYSYLRNTPALNPKKIFYADFKRVSSLKVGAYVYLNGVDVGRVKDIELRQDGSNQIRVKFTVKSSYGLPVGSRAIAYTPNPMYQAMLYLRFDSLSRKYTAADYLKEGAVLPGEIGSYLADMKTFADPYIHIADSLLLDAFPSKDSVEQLFRDTRMAISAMATSSGTYRKKTYDNRSAIIELMLNMRDFSNRVDSSGDEISKAINQALKQTNQLTKEGLVNKIPKIHPDSIPNLGLDKVSQQMNTFEAKVRKMNEGRDSSTHQFLKDPKLRDDVKLKIDDFQSNIKRYRNHPERKKKKK